MKILKNLVLVGVILVLMAFLVSASEIKGGEIHLVRPDSEYIDSARIPYEYLSKEDLIFYTCIEEENVPVRSSVICKDDSSFEDVELYYWEGDGNCQLGGYDLGDKKCNNMLIETEYEKDGESFRLEKRIQVNHFSSIFDHVKSKQYSDGGWLNSTETAAGVWVLSNFRNIFDYEIHLANRWLKLNRDNEDKCWPGEDCTIRDTAKVLSMLNMAKNNDSLRIMHDGNILLEKWQNYFERGDIWNLTIEPYERGITDCIITYQRDYLNEESFSINESEKHHYGIDVAPEEELYVICDQNVGAKLETDKGEVTFVYEGDSLKYTIPHRCWSENDKWQECDLRTTLYALLANVSDERKEAAMEYVETKRKSSLGGEDFLNDTESVFETSMYNYVLNLFDSDYEIDSIVSWLRFRQNNEGSWGAGDFNEKIRTTAFSILGLSEYGFSRNDEVISDAEDWVNKEEIRLYEDKTSEYEGWGSTENDAFAFTVLKNNARPLLKFEPILIILDEETKEVEVYNPTTFPMEEVTYHFSEGLEDKVEIENKRDEIAAYSYIRLRMSHDEDDSSYGYLTVKNKGVPVAKVPIMIVDYPLIDFELKEEHIYVFGTENVINFDINKTDHNFKCNLTWQENDISSEDEFSINNDELRIDISFREPRRVERTYNGVFFCEAQGQTFEQSFSFDASRYITFPFELSPDTVIINETGKNANLTIQNNLDESIEVSLSFENSQNYFELSTENIALNPRDEEVVTILNNVPPEVNVSETNIINAEALEQKRNVNFQAFVIGKSVEERGPLLFWVSLIIVVSMIAGLGFGGYYYRDRLKKLFLKEDKLDETKLRIKRYEEKEKNTAIENMINLMRMLNKEDKEIKEKLKEEGFTEDEITKGFESEASEPEEEDKEKGS